MLLFEVSVSLLKSERPALGAVYTPVIQTARWVTAKRARESERSDRLFFDPLAKALAGEERRSSAIGKVQPSTRRHSELHFHPHSVVRRNCPARNRVRRSPNRAPRPAS